MLARRTDEGTEYGGDLHRDHPIGVGVGAGQPAIHTPEAPRPHTARGSGVMGFDHRDVAVPLRAEPRLVELAGIHANYRFAWSLAYASGEIPDSQAS